MEVIPEPANDGFALDLRGVRVWVSEAGDRRPLIWDVDWHVRRSEHWVVLGPNGAGKTTLLSVAGARRPPSEGTVRVLGRQLGRTDIRDLWPLIGAVDPTLAGRFSPELTAADVVLTGAAGTTRPLWRRYTTEDRERADELIELVGCAGLSGHSFVSCSAGERQRLLIARALVPRPALLLLDEPTTGLDLPSRESLLGALADLARTDPGLSSVTVTHHVEEIGPSTSHALLLSGGRVVVQGEIRTALTAETLSRCFGLRIELARSGGRFMAHAVPADADPRV